MHCGHCIHKVPVDFGPDLTLVLSQEHQPLSLDPGERHAAKLLKETAGTQQRVVLGWAPQAGLHVMIRKTRSPSRSIPPDASMNTISPEVFRPWTRSISGVIAATMVSPLSWETAVRAPASSSAALERPLWMRYRTGSDSWRSTV